MTDKVLPFTDPAPRKSEPATPVREREAVDDLPITVELDTDELARAIGRETAHREKAGSRQGDADDGGRLDGPHLDHQGATDSSENTTLSDRRQFPRVRVSFDVDVRVEPARRPARTVVGRIVDLGAGGAFLELDDTFPLGMLMRVQFELPTVVEICCRAIVRYSFEGTKVTGVGIEFLDIKDVERRHIVAFVTKYQRPPTEASDTGEST